jgi:hypothetical protein
MRSAYLYIFVLFIFFASAQTPGTRDLQALTKEEIRLSEIIPSVDNNSTQKVMACAGNASNDNWANAQSLAVNGGSVSGTTCGSMEGGETQGCNTSGSASVWYKFTATSTTQYVKIDHTGGGCYFGSAIYGGSALPTTACGNAGPISCQSSSGGPLTQLYQLTNLTVGATYYIQIVYPAGGPCGSNATFNIGVTTANPGGTITNKPPLATCSSPGSGCFFNSPPSVSTVTSSCTGYQLSANGYGANSIWSTAIQFTSSVNWSNFSWQAIITSNCLGGNVVWLNWTLYDCSCNQLACGDINTLTGSGLACGTCYRLAYQMELANCSSFTTIYPYQNVPSSPTPCTILPIRLLYFKADPNGKDKRMSVEWAALSEQDLREYRLFRSDDGVNFRLLKKEFPKGSHDQTIKYSFEDDCCIGIATRYYKLITIDTDGSVSFEKTIAVTYDNNKEIVKFAPNPAKDNFVITFGDNAKDQETVIQIFDSFGKVVKEETFTAINGFKEFSIEELPAGIYFINLITPASGNELIKYKLVKQ